MGFGTEAYGAVTYGEGIHDLDNVGITIEVAFDSDPLATTQTYTSVAAYAEAFSTRSGRRHEFDTFAAGSATAVLENADRRFDNTHTAGPYYPNVVPMRRLRISAVWGGTIYPLFTGFVEDWPQSYATTGRVLPVELTATDALGFLAGLDVPQRFIELDHEDAGVLDRGLLAGPTSVVAETTGARITRLLDAIGWPSTDRDLDTGASTLPAAQPKGDALGAAQAVQESEDGRIFASPAGKVTFRDRHAPFTRTDMSTSQASITDDVAESDTAYSNLEPRYSRDQIRNDVQIRIVDGEVEVTDAASIARYGRHTHSRSTLLADPAVAKGYAEYVLSRYKEPFLRFEQVRIAAHAQPDLLYPIVLGRGIGQRVTVTRRPDVGDPITSQCHIEGVSHDVGRDGSWYTTWTLSPADTRSFMVLDSATAGVLDTAILAF